MNKDWYFLNYILNNQDSKDKTFKSISSTKLSTLTTRTQCNDKYQMKKMTISDCQPSQKCIK